MAASSPIFTPKRKRTDFLADASPTRLCTSASSDLDSPNSGSSSPRTRVAHRFHGLALADHAPAPAPSDQLVAGEAIVRKRIRISPPAPPAPAEVPETPCTPPPSAAPPHAPNGPFAFDQALFTASPRPSPSRPVAQPLPVPTKRPAEAGKSRARKRAGTPPLACTSATPSIEHAASEARAAAIIDPIRAALTWHEDEITVYDPDDEDDDGVGINGIGFKPTPAIAYARTMKRRQQLAEYRKREEREARARRTLRRRGTPERAAATLERTETAARKVRFSEAEPSVMVETV